MILIKLNHVLAVLTFSNINEQQYVNNIIPIPNFHNSNQPINSTAYTATNFAINSRFMLYIVKSNRKLPSQYIDQGNPLQFIKLRIFFYF